MSSSEMRILHPIRCTCRSPASIMRWTVRMERPSFSAVAGDGEQWREARWRRGHGEVLSDRGEGTRAGETDGRTFLGRGAAGAGRAPPRRSGGRHVQHRGRGLGAHPASLPSRLDRRARGRRSGGRTENPWVQSGGRVVTGTWRPLLTPPRHDLACDGRGHRHPDPSCLPSQRCRGFVALSVEALSNRCIGFVVVLSHRL